MATTVPCQPSNAGIDQYLLIATRLLAVVGFSYLVNSLYRFLEIRLFSHRSMPSGGPEVENIGLDLNDSASASQVSLELDFGSTDGGDLGIRMPEPAYHPRGRR